MPALRRLSVSLPRRGVAIAPIKCEKWTTSSKRTVTCLYSARASPSSTGEPQLWQNRAFSKGSVPHVRHAAMAVTRPSADPAPQRLQWSSKDRPLGTTLIVRDFERMTKQPR